MSYKKGKFSYKQYDVDCVKNFYYLDDKIDYFLAWCEKNEDRFDVEDIKNMIEKLAVWYELRYPDSYFDCKDVDKFMPDNFSQSKVHQQWCDFYDFRKFYYSLFSKEKVLIDKPIYPDVIYLKNNSSSHFHLAKDGTIIDGSDAVFFHDPDGTRTKYVSGKVFDGVNIELVEKIAADKCLEVPLSKINDVTHEFNAKNSFRNGLLDSVMYRIINKGGQCYGSRRGVLFAKEFNRKVAIPVSYGDSLLAKEYIDNDGNKDLTCFVNYFEGQNIIDKNIMDVINCKNLSSNGIDKIKVFSKS